MTVLAAATQSTKSALPFWDQFWLAILPSIVAALLGGLIVGLLIQRSQGRHSLTEFRTLLAIDMRRTSYEFYRHLIGEIRTRHNQLDDGQKGQHLREADLLGQYEKFKIAAQEIEAKLHAYFATSEARYLWHGVVDMLSLRYLRLRYGAGSRPVDGMLNTHSQHVSEEAIPAKARTFFPCRDQLEDDDSVMEAYETMLNEAVKRVLPQRRSLLEFLNRNISSAPRGALILDPGRGPRLSGPHPNETAPPATSTKETTSVAANDSATRPVDLA
jgi:hypothetical protein